MYRLTATKTPHPEAYAISVSKEGSSIEDHFSIDVENVTHLLEECKSIIKLNKTSETTGGRVSLDVRGNAYQMVVRVSEDYVKTYFLTKTEIKLLQASLKRAIDG